MKEQAALRTPGRNDPCWCGNGRKYKKCHMASDAVGTSGARMSHGLSSASTRPVAAPTPMSPAMRRTRRDHLIKTPEQIEGIRQAGKLASKLLDMLEGEIRPGITTNDVDRLVVDFTEAHGARSAPLNYKGFPKSVCTSVNEVVCHGIPEERVLAEGDILNVDVTPVLNGYYGDSSRMYAVGKISPEAERLVRVTRECLDLGIKQVRPGGHIGDIGHAIQSHAEGHGYSVVRDFVGHGTGVVFHEDPQVPHFGRSGTGMAMLPGMVFTIEPMINAGNWHVEVLADKWTAITADGSLSAQWEHTLLVTDDGVEILTA